MSCAELVGNIAGEPAEEVVGESVEEFRSDPVGWNKQNREKLAKQ